MGRQYYTHSSESITMIQMFNCAYYMCVTVLYCFCSFGVVHVFFSLVNVVYVATRKKAFYFQWPSIRASRVSKVIVFDVNRATYCQQNNHFNGCNRFRIIEHLWVTRIGEQRMPYFLDGFLSKGSIKRWLLRLPLERSQCRWRFKQ